MKLVVVLTGLFIAFNTASELDNLEAQNLEAQHPIQGMEEWSTRSALVVVTYRTTISVLFCGEICRQSKIAKFPTPNFPWFQWRFHGFYIMTNHLIFSSCLTLYSFTAIYWLTDSLEARERTPCQDQAGKEKFCHKKCNTDQKCQNTKECQCVKRCPQTCNFCSSTNSATAMIPPQCLGRYGF